MEGFQIDNITERFGKSLDSRIHTAAAMLHLENQPSNSIAITTLDGLAEWCRKNVVAVLAAYMEEMGYKDSHRLSGFYHNANEADDARLQGNRPRTHFFVHLDGKESPTIVVGKIRARVDIHSSQLFCENVQAQHLRRLERLAHLCSKSGTRYGFFHTEEEVMVCHFGVDCHSVEIEAVHWGAHEGLTTQLALFVLCLLSLREKLGRELIT